MSSLNDDVEAFRLSLDEGVPYCMGTTPLSSATSTLFYKTADGKASLVDFRQPDEDALVALTEACEPAPFGRGMEEVLDDSVRKAWKMNIDKFSISFTPVGSEIIDAVRDHFASRKNNMLREFRSELYKLNVYGPGSFFKSHFDTPRAENMFGSLVVVLPTQHKGGSLRFQEDDKEWTFDSASAVSSADGPSVAWVAFPGDLSHEVLPVESGYRVTLTYILYLDDFTPPFSFGPIRAERRAKIGRTLQNLFARDDFLPFGGFVGFGLAHRYVFDPNQTKPVELKKYEPMLKGRDADLMEILSDTFGLNPALKAAYLYRERDRYYSDGEVWAFTNHYVSGIDFLGEDDDVVDVLKESTAVDLFQTADSCTQVTGWRRQRRNISDSEEPVDEDQDSESDGDYSYPSRSIYFFTPARKCNDFLERFALASTGNQPGNGEIYGSFCFIVKVAPLHERNLVDNDGL